MLDITTIHNAINVLTPLLNKNQVSELEHMIGEGIIKYYEDRAESNYRGDLQTLGIDLKLDVDTSFYEDPF